MRIRRYISLLVLSIMLISMVLITSPTRAVVGDFLYYTEAELTTLKGLTGAGSHSGMWSAISTWADAHVDDELPAKEPGLFSDIRQFIGIMVFMYHMTDDEDYAAAARGWMLDVAAWDDWIGMGAHWQWRACIGMGMAIGYDGLKDYLTTDQKTTIRTKMVSELGGGLYDRYAPFGATYFPSGYPNHEANVGSSLGMCAMALGEDYAGSSDWLSFAVECVEYALGLGGLDGGWIEGGSYYVFSMWSLTQFMDAYRRIEEVDYFDTYSDYLADSAYYFIYMNLIDPTYGGTPLQMEDCTGSQPWDRTVSPSFLYKLADEYTDTYAQKLANTYAWQFEPHSYIWKASALGESDKSGLAVDKYFRGSTTDIGYAIWRSGWGDHDLISVFKCGRSLGHAHNDQNSFSLWNDQYMLTGGSGYATSRLEYDQTNVHNCIIVDPYQYYADPHPYGWEEGFWTGGQAQEKGDLATVAEGTTGDFQEHVTNAYYSYARGEVTNALYTDDDSAYFPTGDLTSWVRQYVMMRNPFYMVIFDQVSDGSSHEYNWCFNGKNIYNQSHSIAVADDVITYTLGSQTVEIKIVEPANYTSMTELDPGPYGRDFYRAHIYPASATTADFLMVMCANNYVALDDVTITHVDQNNCKGVIVTYDDGPHTYKDIIVFSDDGNDVSETIDLGLACEARSGFPADGYSFDGDNILTGTFNPWLIVRAQDSGEPAPPPAYKPKHIILWH